MVRAIGRESFYETYVTVIYGFVAVVGLESFFGPDRLAALTVQSVLFFLGALITGWHFWLICLASNDFSDSVYSIVTAGDRPSVFTAFLLADVAFATLFAAPIVVMLGAASTSPSTLVAAFAVLTALSLAYDVLSLVIAAFASLRGSASRRDQHLPAYIRVYASWLWQDVVYIVCGFGVFALHRYAILTPFWISGLFLGIAGGGIVWDVVLRNPALYRTIQADEELPETTQKRGLTRR